MNELRRHILGQSLRGFDLFVSVFAFALASLVSSSELQYADFAEFLTMRIKLVNAFLFLGLVWGWSCIFRSIGLYCDGTWYLIP